MGEAESLNILGHPDVADKSLAHREMAAGRKISIATDEDVLASLAKASLRRSSLTQKSGNDWIK